MDLNTLRNTWKRSDTYTTEAAGSLWNSRADHFEKKKLPSFEEDSFLQLIQRRIALTPELSALDIGCGTGVYTLALAPRVGRAVGCDVSDRMIDIAADRARTAGFDHVQFVCTDWQTADIDHLAYRKSFDLVFAHMTPAVDDFITLDKMVACAKKHCFIRKPARRTDLVLDGALEQLGLSRQNKGPRDTMEYIFSYLWNMGFEPQYHYEKRVIENDKTIQEAQDWIIGWAKMQKEVTQADEEIVRRYLEKLAVKGIIHEDIKTTNVTIDWAV